jgi:Mrp family chromosome partitioning ATPase
MEPADAVQTTEVPNLSVLPCGPRRTNPAELLTDPRFEEVLEQLRESYDFVLVDTPPLLAVSDPCTVAPRVDGVLFVLRPAKNGRPPAERGRDLLAESGARVLGVVVNGVARAGAGGYGYEHYAPGYEYADNYSSPGPESEAPHPADKDEEQAAGPAGLMAAHGNGNGHAPEPPFTPRTGSGS